MDNSQLIKRLLVAVKALKTTWKYGKNYVISLCLLLFVLSILPVLTPILEGRVIDEIVRSLAQQKVLFSVYIFASAFLFVSLLQQVGFVVQRYFEKRLFLNLREDLQAALREKISSLDVATLEDPDFNNQLQLAREKDGPYETISTTERLLFLIQSLIQIIFISLAFIAIKPVLIPVLIIATIPQMWIEARFGEEVWGIYYADADSKRRYYNYEAYTTRKNFLIESKTLNSTYRFLQDAHQLMQSFFFGVMNKERQRTFYLMLANIFMYGLIALSLYIMIDDVLAGTLSPGSLVAALSLTFNLSNSFSGFFSSIGSLSDSIGPVENFLGIFDTQPRIVSNSKAISINTSYPPRIEFRNVSFHYPTSSDLVLNNFNLTINAGEKIAIIGANGAGKSTFIKLLCRFYDATEGEILINGTDIKDIDLAAWYETIGLLTQDYATYNLQVADSISLARGLGSENRDRTIEVATRSESSSFINQWAKKYNQQIGVEFPEGVDPSVGQKQKLAIARTLYKDPKLLILDEPTASIDAEAESKIFENLENRSQNQTLILISHRFSTVRNADRIVVIEDGRVTENGTHHELLGNEKTYARLFRLQAKGYQ